MYLYIYILKFHLRHWNQTFDAEVNWPHTIVPDTIENVEGDLCSKFDFTSSESIHRHVGALFRLLVQNLDAALDSQADDMFFISSNH